MGTPARSSEEPHRRHKAGHQSIFVPGYAAHQAEGGGGGSFRRQWPPSRRLPRRCAATHAPARAAKQARRSRALRYHKVHMDSRHAARQAACGSGGSLGDEGRLPARQATGYAPARVRIPQTLVAKQAIEELHTAYVLEATRHAPGPRRWWRQPRQRRLPARRSLKRCAASEQPGRWRLGPRSSRRSPGAV